MRDDQRAQWRCRLMGVARLLLWIPLTVASLWAFGALWFDFPRDGYGAAAAWVFAALVLMVALVTRPRWLAMCLTTVVVLGVAGWWQTLQPRQFRDWQDEVALPARAEIDGDQVVVHHVRNFEYRTAIDFTPRYELRTFNLSRLRGVDLFINYWGSEWMAHPIASFDFGGQGRICFSIETRMEKGESYSAIGGLYRRFELFYVVADERDVVGVRTNHREGEDVYLYRLMIDDPEQLFLEYVQAVNALAERPKWYNAITNNCTTAIRHQTKVSRRAPMDWRVLVNGFADRMLYERGALEGSIPFEELKRRSLINERARGADQAADFSDQIRVGLPGWDD